MRFARTFIPAIVLLIVSPALYAQPDPGKETGGKEKTEPKVEAAKEPTAEEIEARKKNAEAAAGLFGMGILMTVIFCGVVLLVEMTPTWIALLRGHPNLMPIFIVNFFLSWTCIGWIVALAWSFSAIEQPQYRRRRYHDDYDD